MSTWLLTRVTTRPLVSSTSGPPTEASRVNSPASMSRAGRACQPPSSHRSNYTRNKTITTSSVSLILRLRALTTGTGSTLMLRRSLAWAQGARGEAPRKEEESRWPRRCLSAIRASVGSSLRERTAPPTFRRAAALQPHRRTSSPRTSSRWGPCSLLKTCSSLRVRWRSIWSP